MLRPSGPGGSTRRLHHQPTARPRHRGPSELRPGLHASRARHARREHVEPLRVVGVPAGVDGGLGEGRGGGQSAEVDQARFTFFLIWLPDFFKKTRGLDIKKSWLHLVTIYVIVTVLSIIGGWLSSYLVRRGFSANRARKTSMLVFALCVLPVLLVTQAGNWGAVLLIGIAGAAHQAWSANLFTTVSDMFPKRAVASIVGIGGMAGSIGGILFPIYAGRLLDRFQAAGTVTAGYAILFVVCGTAYLVAFGGGHLLAPRFEPVPLKAA